MARADSDKSAASTAAQFEAEVLKNARPMLNPEERKEAGRKKAALEARWAAARAREAAQSIIAKAEEFEAQADKFEKGS